MRDFWDFLASFSRTFISSVTGGVLAVFLTIWSFYAWRFPPSGVLWSALACYFFFSAFGIWRKERLRAVEAEARLSAPAARLGGVRQKANLLAPWQLSVLGKLLESRKMHESLAAALLLGEGFGKIDHPFAAINEETGWLQRGDRDEYTIQILYESDLREVLGRTHTRFGPT